MIKGQNIPKNWNINGPKNFNNLIYEVYIVL